MVGTYRISTVHASFDRRGQPAQSSHGHTPRTSSQTTSKSRIRCAGSSRSRLQPLRMLHSVTRCVKHTGHTRRRRLGGQQANEAGGGHVYHNDHKTRTLPVMRVFFMAGKKSLSPVITTATSYASGTEAMYSISTARLMSTHFSPRSTVTNRCTS